MKNLLLNVNSKDLKSMSSRQLGRLRYQLNDMKELVSKELEKQSKEDNLLVN